MALLDDVKLALRISSSAFDSEVTDLIDASRADLKLSGVLAVKADAEAPDALIKRAVVTYAKANFGFDNPDADRLRDAYNMLKAHLTLSQEYTAAGDAS
ncbi:head-tail connector protein [Cohnella lubricantis]|uniref:DNA-packaging protein n=1 Tax=Cohnella lubricantis TaxID=2163172 RepID=A0A841T3S0_9BACL|nr:head-tail connector protein [Cohnella lubricantis]MBB6675984.1 DNA-packaging protein [Cohnella lubricantis]MBP2117897.1 putative phage protein (predicted DNA packaging) [Cohnella lubricantis]